MIFLYILPLPLLFFVHVLHFLQFLTCFQNRLHSFNNLIGGFICLFERRLGDGFVLAWSPSWRGALSIAGIAGWSFVADTGGGGEQHQSSPLLM